MKARSFGLATAFVAACSVVFYFISRPIERALAIPAEPLPPGLMATPKTPEPAVTPFTVTGDGGRPVVIYPPHDKAQHAPSLIMLHGMCSGAAFTCDFWSEGARSSSFLVCPTGNSTCGEGYADWGGPTDVRVASVESSLDAAEAEIGERLDHDQGDIIAGFSRGAFLARDYLYATRRQFRGAIFLGAAVSPDPKRLRDAGIVRVVLGSGDLDGARSTMEHAAEKLTAAGIPAKFIRLGPFGHNLPENLAEILEPEIAWIRAPGST